MLGDKQNHERIDHIKEMSVSIIKHETKDIETMLGVIEIVLAEMKGRLTIPQLDALIHLKHQFLNAKPEMQF